LLNDSDTRKIVLSDRGTHLTLDLTNLFILHDMMWR